ncbi:XRE family transcriptional regulator [Aureimonas ureilytica]|uniref:XRE family transcriptional regulator n=1 Tax=Aureimonas ureilytica TaxID=401562 RepID=A0A175R6U2_9HYPH|nr:cupin domain-containing protein [Aureimonas ureilytica]KTQ94170.1 XRE family transcriptional regulator [Aureimonas ureilytica]KTR07032.1 XRE family transcriptional regulator [Aureimonas ureilytica]
MADKEFDVGGRLRTLRAQAGLSQRGLAERAGVPHAQISVVEQNKSSPSVSTLRKILGGLGVSMSDFFNDSRSAEQAGPFFAANGLIDLTSRIRSPGYLSLRQVGDAKEHNLQILHEVYGPGADTGEILLQHASSEGGIVVEGEIEVTVGTLVRILRVGESYLFDSRIPHRFRNVSSTTAVVISACSPPYL